MRKRSCKKKNGGLPRLREGVMVSYFLMGTEFQFYKRKRTLRMDVVMVAQ